MLDLVILGIVQGLTEFLPVSSTAHLLFVEHFLGISRPGVVLEAVLHLGTAAAAGVMFWPDLVRIVRAALAFMIRPRAAAGGAVAPEVRMALAILVATLITGALGLAFSAPFERMFESVRGTAYQLLLTGAILLWSRERGTRTAEQARVGDGVAMGVAQALSIVPGISRSGATIVAGIGAGLRRAEAARLSFLMAIPAIVGAGLYSLRDAGDAVRLGYTPAQLLVAAVVAGVFGAVAIRWLITLVQRGRLITFSVYCWAVGLFVLATVR